MPTPPAESIGGRLVSQLKETIKDKRKCLDFMMASVIFIVTVIELWSLKLSEGKAAIITDPGNNYILYWFPLTSALTIWFFAGFFYMKILRYNSCIYTKIISIIYFLIQSINVTAYLLQFGSDLYYKLIYPIFLFSIVGLTLIKVIRWLSLKPQ